MQKLQHIRRIIGIPQSGNLRQHSIHLHPVLEILPQSIHIMGKKTQNLRAVLSLAMLLGCSALSGGRHFDRKALIRRRKDNAPPIDSGMKHGGMQRIVQTAPIFLKTVFRQKPGLQLDKRGVRSDADVYRPPGISLNFYKICLILLKPRRQTFPLIDGKTQLLLGSAAGQKFLQGLSAVSFAVKSAVKGRKGRLIHKRQRQKAAVLKYLQGHIKILSGQIGKGFNGTDSLIGRSARRSRHCKGVRNPPFSSGQFLAAISSASFNC